MNKQNPYILANPPLLQPTYGARTYEVTLQTKISGTAQPIDTTLSYTLEIEYSGHLFEFKKSNLKVDNKTILKKIDELYSTAVIPLNHLEFSCSSQGVIEKLHNHKSILKHWVRTKNIIEHEFSGTPMVRFLKLMDRKYQDEEILRQRLSNDFVLKAFYRSFLNDYLVYYGRSKGAGMQSNLIDNIPLLFSINKRLGMEGDQLLLESEAMLNKEKVDWQAIEAYFKQKNMNFNKDALHVTLQDRSILEYHSVWIQQTRSVQTVTADTYKKEIILTLTSI